MKQADRFVRRRGVAIVASLVLLGTAIAADRTPPSAKARLSAQPTIAAEPGDGGDGGSTNPSQPTFFEQGGLIRAGEVIQPLGPNLMGDTLAEYSGSLAFQHVDVRLPGNNALQVHVGRQLNVGTRQAALGTGLFGDWDLDIPRLHTVAFQDRPDWYGSSSPPTYNTNRCSQLHTPPSSSYTAGNRMVTMHPATWWAGYTRSAALQEG